MTEYKVKNDTNHGKVLIIDDSESCCPFQQAMAIPNQNSFGQPTLQIMRFPCSTRCPFAETYEQTNGIRKYVTRCTGIVREYVLEPEARIKPIDDLIN